MLENQYINVQICVSLDYISNDDRMVLISKQ